MKVAEVYFKTGLCYSKPAGAFKTHCVISSLSKNGLGHFFVQVEHEFEYNTHKIYILHQPVTITNFLLKINIVCTCRAMMIVTVISILILFMRDFHKDAQQEALKDLGNV